MLKATDTAHAPWYIVRSDDKRRARLNCIAHILSQIPMKKVERAKVKLPKRGKQELRRSSRFERQEFRSRTLLRSLQTTGALGYLSAPAPRLHDRTSRQASPGWQHIARSWPRLSRAVAASSHRAQQPRAHARSRRARGNAPLACGFVLEPCVPSTRANITRVAWTKFGKCAAASRRVESTSCLPCGDSLQSRAISPRVAPSTGSAGEGR